MQISEIRDQSSEKAARRSSPTSRHNRYPRARRKAEATAGDPRITPGLDPGAAGPTRPAAAPSPPGLAGLGRPGGHSEGQNTRSHPELGRENPQRRWYCVSRRGRVGRRQALQTLATPTPDPSAGPARPTHKRTAGWSSPVARQAHNLKVRGSNPLPATTDRSDPDLPWSGSLAVHPSHRSPMPRLDAPAPIRAGMPGSSRAGRSPRTEQYDMSNPVQGRTGEWEVVIASKPPPDRRRGETVFRRCDRLRRAEHVRSRSSTPPFPAHAAGTQPLRARRPEPKV